MKIVSRPLSRRQNRTEAENIMSFEYDQLEGEMIDNLALSVSGNMRLFYVSFTEDELDQLSDLLARRKK